VKRRYLRGKGLRKEGQKTQRSLSTTQGEKGGLTERPTDAEIVPEGEAAVRRIGPSDEKKRKMEGEVRNKSMEF